MVMGLQSTVYRLTHKITQDNRIMMELNTTDNGIMMELNTTDNRIMMELNTLQTIE